MMQYVLEEIAKLRNGAQTIIDYHNSNPYRLIVKEDDGSKTAYYFSTPIYNQRTRKMFDIGFKSNEDVIYKNGTNANISITDNVFMENCAGTCKISLPQKCNFISSQEVHCRDVILLPTVNGVALKCAVAENKKMDFLVYVEQPFLNVRANDRCVALMKEQFRPLVVFSCIGATDVSGNVIAPAKMEYQKFTDKKYKITVSSTSPLAKFVIFESNLYENKLFQDTTVESMNPTANNTFGSVGFIGKTSIYGEQWLYSRIDYSKMFEIMDKRIQKAVLHIPKLNRSNVEFSAFKVSARFCSFGSNWNNKVNKGAPVSDSTTHNGYQSIDLASLFIDPQTQTVTKSEGLILKPKIKENGFSVIATGDSYYAPQIFEINYK